ncbi:hypothetical protein F4814DRAFT_302523 [Daldinia grandis]|nr:hypothetical protein F4814DRAFT_302523 [Daldinia grandis]
MYLHVHILPIVVYVHLSVPATTSSCIAATQDFIHVHVHIRICNLQFTIYTRDWIPLLLSSCFELLRSIRSVTAYSCLQQVDKCTPSAVVLNAVVNAKTMPYFNYL